MKVSRRIAQFLLVLLEYGELARKEPMKFGAAHRSCEKSDPLNFFLDRMRNRVPIRYSGSLRLSITQRSSFNRTIHIMLRQGLISEHLSASSQYGYDYDIVLTEEGKKTAIALRREVLEYIDDFSFLLNHSKSIHALSTRDA